MAAGLFLTAFLGAAATTARAGLRGRAARIAGVGGAILPVIVAFLGATGSALVLGGFQVYGGLTGLLCLKGGYLRQAAGHHVEAGLARQVLEILAGREDNVHLLDVLGREFLHALRALAAQAHAKGAQLAQLYLVAVEQLFHQALTHVRDDSFHRSPGEHAVVVGDVLGEFLQRPYLGHLVLGVSPRSLLLAEGGTHHVNRIVYHTLFFNS